MKTESPKFMRGNVADPKRSKDHLATLQESLKLPLIRHNDHSRHLWNLERSARDFFFSQLLSFTEIAPKSQEQKKSYSVWFSCRHQSYPL